MFTSLPICTALQLSCRLKFINPPLPSHSGAGTAVFWVIGASIVFIVLHAAFYNYESEIEDAFELQMEEI